jgi:hypothetical protein
VSGAAILFFGRIKPVISMGVACPPRKIATEPVVISLEVFLVPGKQEATLTSLRILGAGQQFGQRVNDLMGMNDLLIVLAQGLHVSISNEAADEEENENANETKSDCGIKAGSSFCSGEPVCQEFSHWRFFTLAAGSLCREDI